MIFTHKYISGELTSTEVKFCRVSLPIHCFECPFRIENKTASCITQSYMTGIFRIWGHLHRRQNKKQKRRLKLELPVDAQRAGLHSG